MTVKEYLNQAYRIEKDIHDMLEEVATLRAMSTKTTNVISDMPISQGKNKSGLENTVIKLIEREKILDREIDRLVDLRAEIVDAIQSVKNWEERRVLYLRYIGYKDWTAIAEDMHIGLRQIYRFHGRGLKMISIPKKKSANVTKCQ